MPATTTKPNTATEDRKAAAIVGAIFLIGFLCGYFAHYILEVTR
jgi:hypothetical protein